MAYNSIDLSKYATKIKDPIGYSTTTRQYDTYDTYLTSNISINSNIIIFISIIFSIIIFISQYCLNNFGIYSENNNICQSLFQITYTTYAHYYYIFIPICIFIFIYCFRIFDIIIDYINQQYYNYKNNYPNPITNYYLSSRLKCAFDIINKKKEYEVI